MLGTDALLARSISFTPIPVSTKIAAGVARPRETVVPESRETAGIQAGDVVHADAEVEKVPAYMKSQAKDLKAVVEKLEKSLCTLRWSLPQRSDALLIGTRIFLPPNISSAITTDFLAIMSMENFRTRVHGWRYADEYGHTLWDIVKVLVDELRQELVKCHEAALEKQRDGRIHKWIISTGLDSVKQVRLILPVKDTPVAVVPTKDFYAVSEKKLASQSRKRKSAEAPQPAKSSKHQKKAAQEKENIGPALPRPKPRPIAKSRKKS
ncbi:hypothetical protein K438DRAFT_1771107 [Mycena galopus ATCC 62051]|nr:hypothetical protein K438DRAFT_1771107 [Mycena galopus ATCC 62051]